MESSIVSSLSCKEDLRNLSELYFTCEFDFERVLAHEINLNVGIVYSDMNDYQKRQVYLESIDKTVNRIEKL